MDSEHRQFSNKILLNFFFDAVRMSILVTE